MHLETENFFETCRKASLLNEYFAYKELYYILQRASYIEILYLSDLNTDLKSEALFRLFL